VTEEPTTVDPVTGGGPVTGDPVTGDPVVAAGPESGGGPVTGDPVTTTGPESPAAAQSADEPVTVEGLRFNGDGLICAVAQQFDTREVLMVAWMDAEAVRRTLATGAATYFSRSRRQYWVKGETSGHTQRVIEVRHDCDADALLLLVDQTGPACHTGTRSCFENRVLPLGAGSRAGDPPAVG
jgi:phosphoribosyl-AMP cyclohydrolase